jgi:hypothetical protein
MLISAIITGFTIGVVYTDMTTGKALRKKVRDSKRIANDALDLALRTLERDEAPVTEKGEKLILSPLQVKRFGQSD